MTLSERIIEIRAADLHWGFNEPAPHWKTRPRLAYIERKPVDPFPCYPHNRAQVEEAAARVESLFPVRIPPLWYLTEFEDMGRTNGWASANEHWNTKGKERERDIEPYIVLQGKRIPIHPAMTRYLVGHEYGHVVQYFLERELGQAENDQFEKEYANLRGLAFRDDYGGGRWHTNTGEIVANDFRIIVARLEVEYWPHPEVEYPTENKAVRDFWEEHARQAQLKAS